MPKITNDTAYPNVTVPDASDEVLVLQSDVLKKETITQIGTLIGGGGGTTTTVTYNNSDVTINAALTTQENVYVIENASPVQLNLPSVSAANIGKIVEVHKLGAGNLVIDAADSDTINDSSAGGTVSNTEAAQTYAVIRLRLCTATHWRMAAYPSGTWTTA